MDTRLALPFRALRLALGLTATLAGLDKFFNILADWGSYVSPAAAAVLPFSTGTFLGIVGIVEIGVGVTILAISPRIGAYVASAWLLLVSGNLALGGHLDVAVRDVVMSIAAFALARALHIERATADAAVAGRRGVLLASLMACGVLFGYPSIALAHDGQQHQAEIPANVKLRQDMRKLWTDHVIWTRAYIVAAIADQPDAQPAAARLLKNQEDIGTAIAAYYGKAAGDAVTALLKDHIVIAVDVIKFAKAGEKTALQEAQAKWQRNGEDIAEFLSQANPNWPRAALVEMMKRHLSTTTDEVVARLNKNWDADVRAFDVVYQHMLAMADALSDGIIKQFPAKLADR